MKRVKFESPKKQREFFLKVKKKLGIGNKKLATQLGLKSRGSLESYTLMRTSPPMEIVTKLEKVSGIKANYEIIEGKVYRKRREFIPLDPKKAKEILKEKFPKDFDYLDKIIKTDLTITQIMTLVRKKKHTFDNSEISRCIGAYRTNLLSKLVNDINVSKREIILLGHIRKDKNTLSINFNLASLYKILNQKIIKVGLEISQNRRKVRIFPLSFGRKLIKTNGAIKILITEKSGLKIKSNVEIILNPTDFGFTIKESIYDNDAKLLVKDILKEGFELDNQRSTPANHKGDLSLYKNDKHLLIEITRAKSYKNAYFKIGQCFIQKSSWPKAIHILVCKKEFLSKDSIQALKKLNINIIYSDFDAKWGKKIAQKINLLVK